jgi:hypothetical protein
MIAVVGYLVPVVRQVESRLPDFEVAETETAAP